MTDEIIRLAFICTGNSARSQMAEGFARAWAADRVIVESAGVRPFGLSQKAVAAMAEVGLDISRHYSKGLDEIAPEQDFVITLCDHADQFCGSLPAKRERLHWPIPDPVGPMGDRDDPLQSYRRARDLIAQKIRQFLSTPALLTDAPSQDAQAPR